MNEDIKTQPLEDILPGDKEQLKEMLSHIEKFSCLLEEHLLNFDCNVNPHIPVEINFQEFIEFRMKEIAEEDKPGDIIGTLTWTYYVKHNKTSFPCLNLVMKCINVVEGVGFRFHTKFCPECPHWLRNKLKVFIKEEEHE